VHLTIAGAGDIEIDPLSDLFLALRAALGRWGDPSQPVQVATRERLVLVLTAGVRIDPDRRWIDVEPVLRARLLDDFGFDQRGLGQPVTLSEVQSSVQAVRGVLSVDVDVLSAAPDRHSLQQVVPARLARLERTTHVVEAGDTLTQIAAAHGVTAAEIVRRNPGLSLPLTPGDTLLVSEGIRPAQLLLLSPETLTLSEVKP
jgi:LysM repeat protein